MEIYRGLAAGHCGHEELIDFLNYVFGMNGADSGFYRLLPKLYKPENRPEDYNYVVLEDGKLRAAVGAYPIELEVAGHVLRGAGIGNVAVHPFHRRKGYMKDAMGQAMEAILQSGADFAALGGQRQRYSYFGFEPAGLCGTFGLNSANLRHALPGAGEGYAARKIGPEDAAALAAVRRQEKQLAAMKTLLDRMDNAYLHGEDYTPYDFEFHSMIAQCTGNDVMMRLLPTIHESIQAGYHHTRRVEGSYQRASQCHLEMYRGILEHDSERARRAAQRHMMQTMHDSGVEVPSVLVK